MNFIIDKDILKLTEIIQNKYKISNKKAKKIISDIRVIIYDYILKNGIQSLVIGVSGGLDSAVVAALCQEKYTGVKLIGVSIPLTSSNEHKEQAKWVGEKYCSAFMEFKDWEEDFEKKEFNQKEYSTTLIEEINSTLTMTDKLCKKAGFNPESFNRKVLQGNVKARMRMITLYDIARKTNGMVLSTDNYSEYLMGFWTICGDVGDFSPIQKIFKGVELPIIAESLGIRKDIIYQKPSDGLMVTEDNTDEAQLGASYDIVDSIMISYFEMKKITDNYQKFIENTDKDYIKLIKKLINNENETVVNIINRYKNTQYKRNGAYFIEREQIGIENY